ncbi:phosphopantetheine-binding protein [Lusitaniella coriacea]|uniref:phosphopantetheine-binding protein n=1 Tax=Lusitaniella coriacea TaxID=1983105 RepID=UPI003CE6C83A
MEQNPSLDAQNTLKDILKNLGISEELLHDDVLLHRDLQLDSTEIVEIALALKRRLGVAVKLETRQDKTLAEVSQAIADARSSLA